MAVLRSLFELLGIMRAVGFCGVMSYSLPG